MVLGGFRWFHVLVLKWLSKCHYFFMISIIDSDLLQNASITKLSMYNKISEDIIRHCPRIHFFLSVYILSALIFLSILLPHHTFLMFFFIVLGTAKRERWDKLSSIFMVYSRLDFVTNGYCLQLWTSPFAFHMHHSSYVQLTNFT